MLFQTKLLIELKYPEFVNSLEIMKRHNRRFEDLVLNVLRRYGYVDDTSPVIIQVNSKEKQSCELGYS